MALAQLQGKVLGADIEALVQNADPRESVAAAAGNHESVVEPKFDGWRSIMVVDDSGKARFYTRSGNELTGRIPAIEQEIEKATKADGTLLFPPGTILDGEFVAFSKNEHGHLIHKRGPVASCLGAGVEKGSLRSALLSLVVFDLIQHGEVDARSFPLSQRRQALETLFAQETFAKVALIPQMPATQESHDALVAQGYEGSMVKWLDAPYASGKRGAGWWKLKPQATVDVVVMGYKPGEGAFAGMVGAIEFGQHDESGKLVYRGRCSGMDFDERQDFTDNGDAYLGTVVEIAFFCVEPPSKDYPLGAFRSPQFKHRRPDRSAMSVGVHNG